MTARTRRPLADYLKPEYTFHAIAEEDGGFTIIFPDLPGCMTQVDSIEEVPAMAYEARMLWIETEYELGHEVLEPTYAHA